MDSLSISVSISSTVFVIVLVALACWEFQHAAKEGTQKLYKDQDGAATEESQKEYSNVIRVVKFCLSATWIAGLVVSLIAATLNISKARTLLLLDWSIFANWVSQPRITHKQTLLSQLIFARLLFFLLFSFFM